MFTCGSGKSDGVTHSTSVPNLRGRQTWTATIQVQENLCEDEYKLKLTTDYFKNEVYKLTEEEEEEEGSVIIFHRCFIPVTAQTYSAKKNYHLVHLREIFSKQTFIIISYRELCYLNLTSFILLARTSKFYKRY